MHQGTAELHTGDSNTFGYPPRSLVALKSFPRSRESSPPSSLIPPLFPHNYFNTFDTLLKPSF